MHGHRKASIKGKTKHRKVLCCPFADQTCVADLVNNERTAEAETYMTVNADKGMGSEGLVLIRSSREITSFLEMEGRRSVACRGHISHEVNRKPDIYNAYAKF